MKAMVLHRPRHRLTYQDYPDPVCGINQIKVRVLACAVCRTDLHIADGELSESVFPIIPGHEIVGEITEIGSNVTGLKPGMKVGIPWLGWTCGECYYCLNGQENLCDQARFTGYHIHGGYAEYAVADARYAFLLDPLCSPEKTAPLLCAGLIGYRAYTMAGNARNIGLYGFGAAAHIITQVALQENRTIFAFTKKEDIDSRCFALSLGVQWAGHANEAPPEPLDAALIFAPVGALIIQALQHTRKGGRVICAGIHMSDIPSFPYSLLWGERIIRSVANLTRLDGVEFFEKIKNIPLHLTTTAFPLCEANTALSLLRNGKIQGAAVLIP